MTFCSPLLFFLFVFPAVTMTSFPLYSSLCLCFLSAITSSCSPLTVFLCILLLLCLGGLLYLFFLFVLLAATCSLYSSFRLYSLLILLSFHSTIHVYLLFPAASWSDSQLFLVFVFPTATVFLFTSVLLSLCIPYCFQCLFCSQLLFSLVLFLALPFCSPILFFILLFPATALSSCLFLHFFLFECHATAVLLFPLLPFLFIFLAGFPLFSLSYFPYYLLLFCPFSLFSSLSFHSHHYPKCVLFFSQLILISYFVFLFPSYLYTHFILCYCSVVYPLTLFSSFSFISHHHCVVLFPSTFLPTDFIIHLCLFPPFNSSCSFIYTNFLPVLYVYFPLLLNNTF